MVQEDEDPLNLPLPIPFKNEAQLAQAPKARNKIQSQTFITTTHT